MERHYGKELSPEEKEENYAQQWEELEALEAIYGESCEVRRSAAVAAPEVCQTESHDGMHVYRAHAARWLSCDTAWNDATSP